MATSDPVTTPIVNKEPKPIADRETQQMPTMDPMPEPMPAMEPEPEALSFPETKPDVQSDQVYELVYKSVPMGVLIELDDVEWLIDWNSAEPLPTRDPCPHPLTSETCFAELLWRGAQQNMSTLKHVYSIRCSLAPPPPNCDFNTNNVTTWHLNLKIAILQLMMWHYI